MAIDASSTAPLLSSGEPNPGLAIGVAQPNVAWTLTQRDRARGVLIAGGQGSGKTSKLIRLAMDDALAANTALVVLDMKGSMSERLLRQIPTDVPKRYYDHEARQWREGVKRVWYLDLAAPAFGLTPLHVEPGWRKQDLPDLFVRMAGVVLASLTDLFPGQIFRSSEDIIERAVIGTMAIAWFQHDEYHRKAGRDPERFGFSGSFKVLVRMFATTDRGAVSVDRRSALPPNPWHEAAGRACQRIPGMAEMAHQLLIELPGQVNSNLTAMESRMLPPMNKLGPLVYSQAPVRRFVEHRERLSLASVLQAHDILIVNPRKEMLGDFSQPEILVNFMIHMLDQELNRQLAIPQPTRPRVSVVIDEAHTLITPSLMKMVSTHREAGMSVACATQYMAQIGASLDNSGERDYVRHGVTNLLQTKMIGRMADPDDAQEAAGVFRSVWESLTRSDPVSQSRIPVDASNITTIEDWHFFVHVISSGNPDQSGVSARSATSWGGSTALPVFVSRAYPMPELHEIPDTYRRAHLARMAAVFAASTDDPSDQVPQIPPGLGGRTGRVDPYEAAEVARSTVGRDPGPRTPARNDDGPELTERPDEESVGGARIQRTPPAAPAAKADRDPTLECALRPASTPPPEDEPAPRGERLQEAVRYAASIEILGGLGAWTTAGDAIVAETDKQARAAAEAALVAARAEGATTDEIERSAKRAAARVRKDALARHADDDWWRPVDDLDVRDELVGLLELLARLPFSHPALLATLLQDPPQLKTISRNLGRLERAALVASSPVRIAGRGGRPPLLYAVTDRGRELLRRERARVNADREPPRYLASERRLPNDGAPASGDGVPQTMAVQLALAALGTYGGTEVKLRWMTPEMPGGRLDVAMVHRGDHAVAMRDLLPPDGMGLAVVNDSHDAPGVIEPDASVQFDGPVAGRRRSLTLLLEVDGTLGGPSLERKLVAYDHFLAGWCLRLRRFGPAERNARPLVVFVTDTVQAARTLMSKADAMLTIGIGPPGEDPATYRYHGRSHTACTCLPWLLSGQAYALTMPEPPPQLRGGAPRWEPEAHALLPEAWWPRDATSARRTR